MNDVKAKAIRGDYIPDLTAGLSVNVAFFLFRSEVITGITVLQADIDITNFLAMLEDEFAGNSAHLEDGTSTSIQVVRWEGHAFVALGSRIR